ncbi:MAG TPA: SDR family oxidoreductase [Ilumatobacter sp.]|nr:SDR family oxidoreductase [Ilumatobacter sp.]
MSADWPDEPSDRLDGRVAIVTGASADGNGLTNGRAAALVLARAGARVVCVGRRREPAERTAELIRGEGGDALAVAADVGDDAACAEVVRTALDAYGRIDLLDNNVGVPHTGDVVASSAEAWADSWRTNVMAIVNLSRHAIPAMVAAGGGAIVNIGSLRALRPRDEAPYATTKGAVISLTRSMAVSHGPDGVRVNCVVVGPVQTDALLGRQMTHEQREQRRAASVLGVEGTSWDTAHAVRYLLSDRARYVTGQALVVDGGVSLTSPKR